MGNFIGQKVGIFIGRSHTLLGGLAAAGGTLGGGVINLGTEDFRQTILGEATYAAVEDLVAALVDANDKIPFTKPEVRGLVADVQGLIVILNVGTSHEVRVGDTLKVLTVTRTITDPATGKALREITEEIGQVRIDETDDQSSVGTVISGGEIKVGDIVKNQ